MPGFVETGVGVGGQLLLVHRRRDDRTQINLQHPCDPNQRVQCGNPHTPLNVAHHLP